MQLVVYQILYIPLSRLNDGEGIELTLRKHKAKWHGSCRLKYNKTELQRARKRKTSAEDSGDCHSGKFTRQNCQKKTNSTEIYFFCDKPAISAEFLSKASTFQLDSRVWQCAINLQYKQLLSKSSAGDSIAQDAVYHRQYLIALYNRAR